MRKITNFKLLFLICFGFIGALNAQDKKTKVTKELGFVGKSPQELAKTNGFDRCSAVEYEKLLQLQYKDRMSDEQFEAWIAPIVAKAKAEQAQNGNKSQNGNVITIPVVVHVIHSGQTLGLQPNIRDEQVESQIAVMNNDFRRIMGSPGHNTNAVGADTEIQFALAKVDPNGNPTNGINRVNLCKTSWSRADINSYVKPMTIWDPTKYMNMWSLRFTDTTLLGYAQFPSNSSLSGLNTNGGLASTDGVVAKFSTFGSKDYDLNNNFLLSAPYNKGRTMTHEVGHFLGLRHIWGDDADPLVCATDYCNDTPPAHDANYACTTPIASCTTGLSEMFENYMDYTNDTCMNIYTNDQKTRMRAVMNNSPRRLELKTSTADVAIPLFANDAELKGERNCTENACTTSTTPLSVQFSLYNRGTTPLTSAVITYNVNAGAVETYTWTGNLLQDKYAIITIPTGATSGAINAQVVSVNGVADQRGTNNFAAIAIGNSVPTGSPNFTFELQRDVYGSETTWTLTNSLGTVLYSGGATADTYPNLPALFTQNWSLPINDCYTFTINDSGADGFSTYGGTYRIKNSFGDVVILATDFTATQSKTFRVVAALSTNETVKSQETFAIYPNPADDVLNITKISDKAKFEIHNAVGQLVNSGDIKANQVRVAELVKGTYIITIKDKNISKSIKFIKK